MKKTRKRNYSKGLLYPEGIDLNMSVLPIDGLLTFVDTFNVEYSIDAKRFEPYCNQYANNNLAAGSLDEVVMTVGVDRVFHAKHLAIQYSGTVPTRMGFGIDNRATIAYITAVQTIVSGDWYADLVDCVLLPGFDIVAFIQNATLNDNLDVRIFGNMYRILGE